MFDDRKKYPWHPHVRLKFTDPRQKGLHHNELHRRNWLKLEAHALPGMILVHYILFILIEISLIFIKNVTRTVKRMDQVLFWYALLVTGRLPIFPKVISSEASTVETDYR